MKSKQFIKIVTVISFLYFFVSCLANKPDKLEKNEFTIQDFYNNNDKLDSLVNIIFNQLNDTQRLSQMIYSSTGKLGKSFSTVKSLVEKKIVGGVIFLTGEREKNKSQIEELNKISYKNNSIPLIFSIDAEPSLFNRRVVASPVKVKKTIEIKDSIEAYSIAKTISSELQYMGFHHNYAPVVDLSPNNEAIKDRSFGINVNLVIKKSLGFIKGTQDNGIVATAKHFPGHGYVKGDTHKESVYIDGKLKEIDIYKPLIDAGVISIMVAHITIKNNKKYSTELKPASCSKKIVTNLLRNELKFKGIIITDAMNMMAVTNSSENATLSAALAGCDMILMPPDEQKLLYLMLEKQNTDKKIKLQFENSVKRILRLKLCLNVIK